MRGVPPGPIYKFAIEVNGTLYPVKQVFAVATGVDQFTTQRARDVLRRLGFSEQRHASGPSVVPPPGPLPVTKATLSSMWVLEIRTIGGGSHEFLLDDDEDIQALQGEISRSIGSDRSYQCLARRPDARTPDIVIQLHCVTHLLAWRFAVFSGVSLRAPGSPS